MTSTTTQAQNNQQQGNQNQGGPGTLQVDNNKTEINPRWSKWNATPTKMATKVIQ